MNQNNVRTMLSRVHVGNHDLQIISAREKQVLDLISKEFTTKEIARILYVSTHTVDSHKKNLMSKLKARNAAGMVRKGFEYGILN